MPLTTVEVGPGTADVVVLPLDEWEVRVDWTQDPEGSRLGDLDADVLTNAGIFSEGYVPGGLLVSDGVELHPLNLRDGAGNFHLMPNGVFTVSADGTAAVVESSRYRPDGVQFATQSGPLLLSEGQLHPAFTEGSSNVAVRSGVGVRDEGRTVVLVISNGPVNFWDFATMFRDQLGCDDALYLDGQISGLHVPGQARLLDAARGPFAGLVSATRR